ncbi:MAG: fumarylacetoacetate hydrolase family protein [Bacteroidales bacterium]|nr:fumarylacetoacetate hydrolase family protein [Bacteroidales bacterium]MBQ7490461.1 fumarylacetoacetate hydrolase family protein [Bacteroidales bacterium]
MKIICVGKNYLGHIREFDGAVPEAPIFFLKPDTALTVRNRPFFLPDFAKRFDYEVEILLRICKVGKCIQERFAHTYYDAIGLGIDFTARDVQSRCREKGEPWEICKGFDGSAVVSRFVHKSNFPDLSNLEFSLTLNGETVQHGNTADMIFNFDRIISYVSQFITLKMGDIIFTGTPAGIGAVKINDRLQGFIGNEKFLDFRVK